MSSEITLIGIKSESLFNEQITESFDGTKPFQAWKYCLLQQNYTYVLLLINREKHK